MNYCVCGAAADCQMVFNPEVYGRLAAEDNGNKPVLLMFLTDV